MIKTVEDNLKSSESVREVSFDKVSRAQQEAPVHVDEVLDVAGHLYNYESCEKHFQNHPNVERCALVKVGFFKQEVPAILLKPKRKVRDKVAFALELLKWARSNRDTKDLVTFYLKKALPEPGEDKLEWRRKLSSEIKPESFLECPVS